MNTRLLDSGWTLGTPYTPPYHRPQVHGHPEIPASVPGHVHSDLVKAGVIVDPFTGMAEAGAQWVDEMDWVYRCTFDWQPTDGTPRRTLRFGGIDTVATVMLNGEQVGPSNNFFLPLEIDVTDRLVAGANTLEIQIESPVRVGDQRRAEYFAQESLPTDTCFFDERAFVRKPGYMSGWDWGPRLVSAGIWQAVELVEFSHRIVECSVLSEALGGNRFRLKLETQTEGDGLLQATAAGVPFGPDGTLEIESELWWPNGEGRPALIPVEVSFGDHRIVRHVGLRTVELVREKDEWGTTFEFKVNGRRVWARGANWIPHHSFPSLVTREDVFAAVKKYAQLGMNMLRVWGGGLYETEDFYDACDQFGIMVWQDFPYACSHYPDDPTAQQVAREEAAFHIRRLRDRASHVLWCGNNENRSMYYGKWLGTGRLAPRFYGEVIYDDVLKQAVIQGDPGKAYVESSPLFVKQMPGHDDATLNSDDHYWDVWHGRGDWTYYRESDTRFSSEFGFAASCTPATWDKVAPGLQDPEGPVVRWHDKTNKPWSVFRDMVELHYPRARSLEEWICTSQLNQRDALRAAFEHYRTNPACRGALIWQANDCWPVQSWAIEDFSRLLKPAGFEMARLLAPLLLTADVVHGELQVSACNDSQTRLLDELEITFVDTVTGEVVRRKAASVSLDADDRRVLHAVSVSDFQPYRTAFRVSFKGNSAAPRWGLLCEPKAAEIRPGKIEVVPSSEGFRCTVRSFVFDLTLSAETPLSNSAGLAGTFAVTAMPGESFVFRCAQTPLHLVARSLAGPHELVVHQPIDVAH